MKLTINDFKKAVFIGAGLLLYEMFVSQYVEKYI